MGKTKKLAQKLLEKLKKQKPQEARENQMIALAVDLAEKQLTKELYFIQSSPII